jgi:hypothetical protein
MTAGPRASASGERHSIARGIEAEGRDAALRLGSREPGAVHRTRQYRRYWLAGVGGFELDTADWNRMFSPVREEPQHLFSLKFRSPSKHWDFGNRIESAESRASEI